MSIGAVLGAISPYADDAWDFVSGGGDASSWQEHYEREWTGRPLPGAPDARRAARAVAAAPFAFSRIQRQLGESNKGFAPTIQEMQDPSVAHLWVNAAMGGKDGRNNSAPWMPDELRSLVDRYGSSSSFPTVGTPPITDTGGGFFDPDPTLTGWTPAPSSPAGPARSGGISPVLLLAGAGAAVLFLARG